MSRCRVLSLAALAVTAFALGPAVAACNKGSGAVGESPDASASALVASAPRPMLSASAPAASASAAFPPAPPAATWVWPGFCSSLPTI